MSYNREDIDKFVRGCNAQYNSDLSNYYIYHKEGDYIKSCALRYEACMRVAESMIDSMAKPLPTTDD